MATFGVRPTGSRCRGLAGVLAIVAATAVALAEGGTAPAVAGPPVTAGLDCEQGSAGGTGRTCTVATAETTAVTETTTVTSTETTTVTSTETSTETTTLTAPPVTTTVTAPPVTATVTAPASTTTVTVTAPTTNGPRPPTVTPTTVTVPQTPDGHISVWGTALVLALVGALLASAGRAYRRRGLKWMKTHVTVAPRPGPVPSFETQPGDEFMRDHVFTVVPVQGKQSMTVEEDR